MTSAELAELEAFWELEGGFGDHKDEYRFAQLCALMANINRDPKKRSKPFSIKEFMMIPGMKGEAVDNTPKIRATFEFLSKVKKKKK